MNQAMDHVVCLVLLDGIGSHAALGGAFANYRARRQVKDKCVSKLLELSSTLPGNLQLQLPCPTVGLVDAASLLASNDSINDLGRLITSTTTTTNEDGTQRMIGISPFCVPQGPLIPENENFAFQAPTTFDNSIRLLRGLQITKPILLEGSPGVGKTSLVSALSKLTGHRLVRINLSDQTDLMDLFGSDLPVEGGAPGEFAWRDAPFLQAMQNGDWVLLDEINLASQSVLEGLNACLDHRGTVYVSELDRSFSRAPGFRLFAAQNPIQQGGGRKGLPKSFVNRFTQVYIDALELEDLMMICTHLYGKLFSRDQLSWVLEFNQLMHYNTMISRLFGHSGSPWEFNLRDVSRWLEISSAINNSLNPPSSSSSSSKVSLISPEYFVRLMYVDRMRTPKDRDHVIDLYTQVFGKDQTCDRLTDTPAYSLTVDFLRVGHAVLPRKHSAITTSSKALTKNIRLLQHHLGPLESLLHCLSMAWMPILVGESGVGKTLLVRWVANATGHRLVEFSMNSGIDTLELLGGFEQVDLFRHYSKVVDQIVELIASIERRILLLDDMVDQVVNFSLSGSLIRIGSLHSTARNLCSSQQKQIVPLANLGSAVKALLEQVIVTTGSISIEHVQLQSYYANEIKSISSALESCLEMTSRGVSGQFEWVDGVLVDALENGHWLLIDRANLCSPSVLDRLNGLLEPNGVLIVNERGMVNGEVKIVKPHPNFRIIFTVDPAAGELSRAMRNRGIEIYMLPIQSEKNDTSGDNDDDSGLLVDWITLAATNGITDLHIGPLHCFKLVKPGDKTNLSLAASASSCS